MHHDNHNHKLAAGSAFPDMSFARVGGGQINPSEGSGWRMLVVYRGKHCPLCKRYLDTLEGLRGDYAGAGIEVMAVSTDPTEKASAEVAEQGWSFPVGCDMSMDQMTALGLYVSSPRSPEETDRPFSEP
ncbi:MAG: redoxin domain-containing protein, partial [Pseudomonadota bacterium]|nr:redoxin domain-containing protein [Pseudomonadota bacterium]